MYREREREIISSVEVYPHGSNAANGQHLQRARPPSSRIRRERTGSGSSRGGRWGRRETPRRDGGCLWEDDALSRWSSHIASMQTSTEPQHAFVNA